MGVWQRISTALGFDAPIAPVTKAKMTAAQTPGFLRAEADATQWEVPDVDVAERQLRVYEKLSWIQVAVGQVARQAAVSQYNVKRIDGDDAVNIPNHAFEKLLRHPNPLFSRQQLLEGTFSHYLLTGNAYWFLNRTSYKEEPAEIWLLPSNRIRPIPDGRMFLHGYMYDPGNGDEVPIDIWQVAHFKNFNPFSMYVGLSPLTALAMSIYGDMAMQQYNANYFGKNNAKAPGALAFADPIDDTTWAQIKSDIVRKHGGTDRNMMLLRNAGQGGVQWVPMSLSQQDMQFLESRQFTRDEIFSIFAPGLASILSINATEANSTTGKRTFLELGVWPHMVAIAEKITSEVLVAWGEGLIGEFDDVRQVDRALRLQEQYAYATVHTVDEVRREFYDSGPLGDERGELLGVEVGKASNPGGDTKGAEQAGSMDTAGDNKKPSGGGGNVGQVRGQGGPTAGKADLPFTATPVIEDTETDDTQAFKAWAKKRLKNGKRIDVTDFVSATLSDVDKVITLLDMPQVYKAQMAIDDHTLQHSVEMTLKAVLVGNPEIDRLLIDHEQELQGLLDQAVRGEIDKGEMESEMRRIVFAALLAAFLLGIGKNSEKELTKTQLAALRAKRNVANDAISAFADDIYNANRYSDNRGEEKVRTRLLLWIGSLLGIYHLGKLLQSPSRRFKWVMGPTEHCTDCYRLSSQVHTAEQWMVSGWQPQSRALACSGYRCQCSLVETNEPESGTY